MAFNVSQERSPRLYFTITYSTININFISIFIYLIIRYLPNFFYRIMLLLYMEKENMSNYFSLLKRSAVTFRIKYFKFCIKHCYNEVKVFFQLKQNM